jgi:hypothetical protein
MDEIEAFVRGCRDAATGMALGAHTGLRSRPRSAGLELHESPWRI